MRLAESRARASGGAPRRLRLALASASLVAGQLIAGFAVASVPVKTESLALYDTAVFNPGGFYGSDFGASLAATQQYLAIGMPRSTRRPEPAHAVFIHDPQTGALLRTLTASQPESVNFNFGTSVAISGNLAVVGASYEHVTAPEGDIRYNAGAAYVFDLTTGQQIAKLIPQDPVGNLFMGSSVAIHGTDVLIGGWGAAYHFNALTGQQLAKFNPSSLTGQFGISVALNDQVAVIGANSDESRGSFTGAAFVFDLASHAQLRKIVPADAMGGSLSVAGDNFGLSLALDGNKAIIGSPLHSSATGNGGAAYVFDVSTGAQLAKFIPPLPGLVYPENFGGDVEIRGNIAVVGAQSDSRRGQAAGAAFMFDWTTGQAIAELVPTNINESDLFGFSVTLNDQSVFVGAPSKDQRGGAYRFKIVPEPASSSVFAGALLGGLGLIRPRRST